MKVKVIKNRYETTMDSLNLDIKRLVMSPNYYKNKEDIPLFNFSSNLCDKPTKRAGFDHQGSSVLTLDYDNGFTFEDWTKKYPNLLGVTFIAYSSYSNSPEKAKFRVIIPLDRVYSDLEWKALTPSLKRYFPDNDSCSFQISRFFNIPSKTEHYWYNLNFKSVNLSLLDMLGIDDGFLALLVSRIKDKNDNIEEQPVAPCKSVLGYTAVGNLTVLEWLETKWNTDGSGNGGMFHRGLYGALLVAVKYSDWETVGKIKNACARVGESKRFDKTLRDVQ